MIVPETVLTQSLELRRPEPSDVDDIFVYGSDKEVAYYTDWKPVQTKDQLEERLRKRKIEWESGDAYYWVITERGVGKAIGGISCTIIGENAEIGYLLNKDYWRRGYATEAATAIVNWLKSVQAVTRISATCDTENIASIRVLEKIGMNKERIIEKYLVRPNIDQTARDAFLFSLELDHLRPNDQTIV
ncbi:MAG: GNAT family N-acetyltransferase [Anaerolineae bacterium]|nr:GNAT family N-acetyltransferase [Anaerolineae bacterium]